MSVDPDDVTRLGIREAGATAMHYGAAALPGARCSAANSTVHTPRVVGTARARRRST